MSTESAHFATSEGELLINKKHSVEKVQQKRGIKILSTKIERKSFTSQFFWSGQMDRGEQEEDETY